MFILQGNTKITGERVEEYLENWKISKGFSGSNTENAPGDAGDALCVEGVKSFIVYIQTGKYSVKTVLFTGQSRVRVC